MASNSPVTIVNVGYRSTNYWVVSAGRSRLLVDIGWPGTMGWMRANLRRMGIPLGEICYALATHYHIDHAGLAQEFKQAGVPLLVVDVQAGAIPRMKQWTKPWDHDLDITIENNTLISCADSRDVLARIGLSGEILHTPGHSEDSVSLLLDDGSAFTGDLPPEGIGGEESSGMFDGPAIAACWVRLRARGVRRVYPAHGPERDLGASPE